MQFIRPSSLKSWLNITLWDYYLSCIVHIKTVDLHFSMWLTHWWLEFHSYMHYVGFYGVMVSTLDFESSDPSSNLGRTLILFPSSIYLFANKLTPWRNGSASDSRSEGCVFESRRGQTFLTPAFCQHTACMLCCRYVYFNLLLDQETVTKNMLCGRH